MTDVDLTGQHPCPAPGCHVTVEEHHRVNVGLVLENAALRKQQREGQAVEPVPACCPCHTAEVPA